MLRYSVIVPPRVCAGVRRHAAAAAPAECCGALIGSVQGTRIEVRAMIPVPNAAPTGQYSIDAPTVLRLERQAQCVGMSVVGFYHSHPESAPAPSELDLELACPGFVYLIVDGAAAQVRAWRLRDDRSGFHELDLLPLAGAA